MANQVPSGDPESQRMLRGPTCLAIISAREPDIRIHIMQYVCHLLQNIALPPFLQISGLFSDFFRSDFLTWILSFLSYYVNRIYVIIFNLQLPLCSFQ